MIEHIDEIFSYQVIDYSYSHQKQEIEFVFYNETLNDDKKESEVIKKNYDLFINRRKSLFKIIYM